MTAKSDTMQDQEAAQYIEQLASMLKKLRSPRITYFPIRHHSPACSARIERWINENRPVAILVEGPSSFTERIPFLVDERSICPFAVYTSFVDKKERLLKLGAFCGDANADAENSANDSPNAEPQPDSPSAESTNAEPQSESPNAKPPNAEPQSDLPSAESLAPESLNAESPNVDSTPPSTKPPSMIDDLEPRFAAYYPFCDYSPELVALRTGYKIGAKLRFIDLEYGEMILAQHEALKSRIKEPVFIESLAEDAHLKHSKYMKALATKMGCRDFNELWDHLFESSWDNVSTDAFIDRLASYCAMARMDYTHQHLEEDGTVAREACMAAAICEELDAAAGNGPILVVTGGFHTVVLPDLVEKRSKRPEPPTFAADEIGAWLIRYSFDQLDSLAGYSAGMPSPAFYDRLWSAARNSNEGADRFEKLAGEILVEIGRMTRDLKMPNMITTPDAIAAMQMTKQLAALRGHSWPTREDVLDGIRSCFIKGELGVEGQLLLKLVRDVLAGNRIGELPPGCDQPPIFDDFYSEAKRLNIAIKQVERKEHKLELYRSSKHRETSRFFHRLALLGVRFANLIGGPDFVHGKDLELIIERWESTWSPLVEGNLMDVAIMGNTIEEAATNTLLKKIASLEDEAQGRCTTIVVELLTQACRLGLHARCSALVPLIDTHIADDPSFPSVVQGLAQLELLFRAREPLEASSINALAELMQTAYQRSCRLLVELNRCSKDQLNDMLNSLLALREVLAAELEIFRESGMQYQRTVSKSVLDLSRLDPSLFFDGLLTLIEAPPHESQAAIVGAAAGILYSEGCLTQEQLIGIVCGYLGASATDPSKSAGILRGLLHTSCEIAWQMTEIIAAFDRQFQNWSEETFMELLPELRLAFSVLTPRDIARVADNVSSFYGGSSLGDLLNMDLDESTLHFGLSLNHLVGESLKADGLEQ